MSDWTTPKTWVVDELVTAPLLNTHLRDNLGYLFARPGAQVKLISGAAYGVPSTSYVPVDSANLRLTLATASGRVLIGLTATLTGNATLYAGFRGFRTAPVAAVLDPEDTPKFSEVALPMIRPPASRIRCTTVASSSTGRPRRSGLSRCSTDA